MDGLKDTRDDWVEEIEKPQIAALQDPNHDEEYSYKEQRHIIHKVDARLVTSLGLLFAVSLLDRTNLGAANIAGMSKDLGLTKGTRYSIIILVFFIPYVLFQLPSSVLVRKAGPRTFLPGITFLWGIVMMCSGFSKNWETVAGLRVIVGALEAGLFPGAIYLLSVWYSRYDMHKRYASFYWISLVGSAFGGILAYGFMQMAGLGGLAGWQWIFIMEGLLTLVISAIGYVALVDFPEQAHKSWKFLTEKEAAYVIRRINRDRQDADEEAFALGKFLKPALDLKIWGFAFLFFCGTVVAYALSFFLPVILVHSLGYSTGVSQVLTTPPYIFSALFMFAEGWLGDKYHLRSPIVIWNAVQTIIGLGLLGWVENAGVQYFAVFLVAAGCNSNVPAVMAWQANNIRGQWKRAFCSASLISFGGLGGIVGALVFRSQDAPRYLPGVYASIACNVLTIVVASIMVLYFRHVNRAAAAGKRVIEGLEGFQYTL